jgi:predicted PurR-regulated permease PerM
VTRLLVRSVRADPGVLGMLAHGLIVSGFIIAFLYVGRSILEPLVIAALLAFILSPLIRRLRQWGVWRAPCVALVVVLTLGVLSALAVTIAIQITQLAEDLPAYETNLRRKIRELGAGKLTSSALERASGTLTDLQEEISKAGPAATTPGQKPVLVELRHPEPRGLETIANLVRPLLSPLAMTALVVLFLIFILLQREDIRDRFLRLAGTADLQRSTAALDDAGSRLSRFFLMQTALNTAHRFVAGGYCRLDAFLDTVVGAYWAAPSHPFDRLPCRSRQAHRSAAIHRGVAWGRTGAPTGRKVLSAPSCRR